MLKFAVIFCSFCVARKQNSSFLNLKCSILVYVPKCRPHLLCPLTPGCGSCWSWDAALFLCLGVAVHLLLPRGAAAAAALLHKDCVLARRNKASLFSHLAISMESAAPMMKPSFFLLWNDLMALVCGRQKQLALVWPGCVCVPSHCMTPSWGNYYIVECSHLKNVYEPFSLKLESHRNVWTPNIHDSP